MQNNTFELYKTVVKRTFFLDIERKVHPILDQFKFDFLNLHVRSRKCCVWQGSLLNFVSNLKLLFAFLQLLLLLI